IKMLLLKNFWLFLFWMCLILYLSFVPLQDWPQPSIFQKLHIDKAVHFTMYAVLSFLLLRSIFRQQMKRLPRYGTRVAAVIFSAGAGVAIEVFQPLLTDYRQFEWMDMMANAIGAISGGILFNWLLSKGRMGLKVVQPG
ncbi:MAG: VanZ family protein, partial [Chitinophagales bacterium]